MPEPLILRSEQAGIVRLTLNRPRKRNALTRELLQELKHHLTDLALRTDIRLLELGAEGTAFCAGMDLDQMQESAGTPDCSTVWQRDAEIYRDVVRALFAFRSATLAVLPGPAMAGGLGLMLACDLVLASETSTFGLPEPRRGITAAMVAPLLVYRVGNSAAAYLLLSGASVDAARARQMGLIHEVASPHSLAAAVGAIEGSILAQAPVALATTKWHLRACAAGDVLQQLDQAVAFSAKARASDEAREGLQAFLEKRNPSWVRNSDRRD